MDFLKSSKVHKVQFKDHYMASNNSSRAVLRRQGANDKHRFRLSLLSYCSYPSVWSRLWGRHTRAGLITSRGASRVFRYIRVLKKVFSDSKQSVAIKSVQTKLSKLVLNHFSAIQISHSIQIRKLTLVTLDVTSITVS